jgi:hypothetical protein
MGLQDELMAIEHRLWTNDADIYDRQLTGDALLAFAETGVISKDTAIAAIRRENRDGRRWADVTFEDVAMLQLGVDSALLTYRVHARWANEVSDMTALASSVYVRSGGEWKLAFHQQTPMNGLEPRDHSSSTVAVRRAGAVSAGAVSAGAAAFGTLAIGALAVGAAAVGALAIGRLAVGAFDVKRGRIRALSVDDLQIGRLYVREQI